MFYWPFIDIFLWGMTTVWIQKSETEIPSLALIVLSGLVLWQVMWRSSYEVTVNLLQEFWHRNLMNLFATPLKLTEWILSLALVGVSKILINIAFSSLVVYLLYTLDVFTMGWVFVPYALSLAIFGWAVGFFCAGIIIYFGQRLQALAWMGAALFAPFSAVYYPVSAMPKWAQAISYCLPTTYIFEGMRALFLKGEFILNDILISFGLNAFFLIFALIFFALMFEKSRQKGFARLE
jgi:ABC-2 type transport system permease protein